VGKREKRGEGERSHSSKNKKRAYNALKVLSRKEERNLSSIDRGEEEASINEGIVA